MQHNLTPGIFMVPHMQRCRSHPDEPESQEMKTSNEPESIYGIGLVVSHVFPFVVLHGTSMVDSIGVSLASVVDVGDELLAVDNKSVHEVKDLIAVRIQRRLCKRIRNPDVRRGALILGVPFCS